jgi:hypothetical protein
MNDHVPFVGAVGAMAGLSLGQWNEIVGITVGALTGIYVIIKTIILIRDWRNAKKEK